MKDCEKIKDLLATNHNIVDCNPAQKEEMFQDYDKLFKKLAQIFPEAVIITNLDGVITEVSQRALELYGYENLDELSGRSVFELIAPEDYEKAMTDLEKTFNERIVKNKEYTMLRKDRSCFICEINAVLIKEDNGKFKAFIITIKDITECKIAEKALKESQKTYSTLVEKGSDGIIIIQDRVLKFANPMILEFTGYSLEEAIGKSFLDFVSPEYRPLVIKRYFKRLAGKEVPNKYEIEIISKDGNKITVEINASIIEYEGKPANMAILRDITERKRDGEMIREYADNLERLVEERTKELRESEELYRDLYKSCLDEIVSANKEDQIVNFNYAKLK